MKYTPIKAAAIAITLFGQAFIPLAAAPHQSHAVEIVDLRSEYRTNPLGIDAIAPRLSWRLQSDTRGTMQTAYQVRVATVAEKLNRGSDVLWDSGKIKSAQSTQLSYAGPPLRSRQRYFWQVRVWNENGSVTSWSQPAWWEMGILSESDWQAQWIAPPIDRDPMKSTPAPLLRSTFDLQGKIARARAYVTSLGLYELHLNGQRVGGRCLHPAGPASKRACNIKCMT